MTYGSSMSSRKPSMLAFAGSEKNVALRPSATAISSSASTASLPRRSAMSPIGHRSCRGFAPTLDLIEEIPFIEREREPGIRGHALAVDGQAALAAVAQPRQLTAVDIRIVVECQDDVP